MNRSNINVRIGEYGAADKLPEVAQRIGSSWRELKRLQERVETEVHEVIPELPSAGDIARIVRSPINLLNQISHSVDAKEAANRPNADEPSVPLIVSAPSRPAAART